MDYGFRISIVGQDVEDCDDLDTAINSKYFNLKGVLLGNGQISHPGDGSTQTVTIAHGLGYIPFATVMTYEISNLTRTLPYVDFEFPDLFWTYWCYCDSTNLYIKLNTTEALTIYYNYFIYIDKGKL